MYMQNASDPFQPLMVLSNRTSKLAESADVFVRYKAEMSIQP